MDVTKHYFEVPLPEGFMPLNVPEELARNLYLDDEFNDIVWFARRKNPVTANPTVYYFYKFKEMSNLQMTIARNTLIELKGLMQIPPLELTEANRFQLIDILNRLPILKSSLYGNNIHPDAENMSKGGLRVDDIAPFNRTSQPMKDESNRWYVIKNNRKQEQQFDTRILRMIIDKMGYQTKIVRDGQVARSKKR